jgi:ribosomal protein S1
MQSLGASTPRDMFREGDDVLVRIVGFDPDQQHIELSIDDVSVDEQQSWMFEKREEDTTVDEYDNAPEASEFEDEF